MKITHVTVLLSLLLGSLAAHAEVPSIRINVNGEIAPGVYGEVQLGNAPPPAVVYAQPVIVSKPRYDEGRPLYLHVPPGHAKNWSRHCGEYNACDRSVYFVKSSEYEEGYREHKGNRHRNEGRSDERGNSDRRDERRYEERRDEGGRSEGRGRDHEHKGRGREGRD